MLWLSHAPLEPAAAAEGVSGQSPASPSRTLRVEDAVLSRELQRQGARVVADYGGFQLLEAPPEAARSVAGHPKVSAQEANRLLELNAGALDTGTVEAQAQRKARGKSVSRPPGRRLHLVQFAGPVKPEWRAQLAATGVEIVSYVPRNAYLVYGEAPALQRLQELAPTLPHVQWDGEYRDDYKWHPLARAAAQRKAPGDDWFAIQLVVDAAANAVTLPLIETLQLEPIRQRQRVLNYLNVIVRLPPARLADLTGRPDVAWVEPFEVPVPQDERQDQIVAGNVANGQPTGPGYLAWLAGQGFTQEQFTTSGFAVDVTDSGIDDGTLAPGHFGLYTFGQTGLAPRVAYQHRAGLYYGNNSLLGCDGHGTLNAHIVAGYNDQTGFPFTDAQGYSHGLGVAPFVRVGASVIFEPYYTYPDFADLQSRAYRDGARISANSWGSRVWSRYTVSAQAYDALVRDAQPEHAAVAAPGNQEMVIVFSAGNSGWSGLGSLGAPGTAKNVFTIGATENVHSYSLANGGNDPDGSDGCGMDDTAADSAEDIAEYSSRGPCTDGRIKPDLVAPGTHVTGGVAQQTPVGPLGTALACFDAGGVCGLPGVWMPGSSNNFFPLGQAFYTTSSGTSHSTPAVAGGCALLRQYFLNRGWAPPTPAMTKAWLMNAARYLAGAGAGDSLPSISQGLGDLNLGVAFDGVPRQARDQVAADTFTATGQRRYFKGSIPDPSRPFRVTLAWTDAPGATFGAAYNNDLDLTVTVGGQTYRGNLFQGAWSVPGGAPDPRNNVESVFLPAGAGQTYLVEVTAANINSDGVPNNPEPLDQDFALVIYNAQANQQPFLTSGDAPILAESYAPPNAALEPGETVTVRLMLTNTYGAATSNLVATLCPGGGVTAPTGPQAYGTLLPGGPAVCREFSFLASGPCGGTLTATLHLADGLADLGAVTWVWRLGEPRNAGTWTFAAPAPLTPESGTAGPLAPYPSPVEVSNVPGAVEKITVTLRDLSHTYPGDLDLLLVGPQGQAVVLMSDAGGGNSVSNLTLIFDAAATQSLPEDLLTSGSFQPTDYDNLDYFELPAPGGNFGTSLAVFKDTLPNGRWELFAYDDDTGDQGAIAAGWTLTLTTTERLCAGAPVPADLALDGQVAATNVAPQVPVAFTLHLTNRGSTVATNARLVLRWPERAIVDLVGVSSGSCTWNDSTATCGLGDLRLGDARTVAVTLRTESPAVLTLTAECFCDTFEANLSNNTFTTSANVDWPRLQASGARCLEGDGGVSTLLFHLSLEPPSPWPVSVHFATADGTATAGSDYLATNGLLEFGPLETSRTISVAVLGDRLCEPEKSFTLGLANPTNARLMVGSVTGTIQDNDPPVTLVIADTTVQEGDDQVGWAFFDLSFSATSAAPVTVAYETRDGTAVAGQDYAATSGTVTFAPGQLRQSIAVEIFDDSLSEAAEEFYVRLFNPVGLLLSNTQARAVISDDDLPPPVRIGMDQPALVAESLAPTNGLIDPGERVTLRLALRNLGEQDTTALLATLRPGDGVSAPSGPQNYERLVAGGAPVSRLFSFTACGTAGDLITATLELRDDSAFLGTTSVRLPLGPPGEFVLLDVTTNQCHTVVLPRSRVGETEGIAVSSQSVFISGYDALAQLNAADLSGGARLSRYYRTLVSNLRTETAYCLGDGDRPFDFSSTQVTSLLELDSQSGELTGHRVLLSTPISLGCGSGVFAGYDRVVLFNGVKVFDISLPWGQVTELGTLWVPNQSYGYCGFYGVAEYFDGAVHLVTVKDPQTILRTRLPEGSSTVLAGFADLGRLSAWSLSPSRGRWYFYQTGDSQWGPATEEDLVVGYADVSLRRGSTNPPLILTHPAPSVVAGGETARFSVVASGALPLQYQWQKEEVDLPGAVQSCLVLSNARPGDAGQYRVRVTNPLGSVLSSNALLRVVAPGAEIAVFRDSRYFDSLAASLQHQGFGVLGFTNWLETLATRERVLLPPLGNDLPQRLSRAERIGLSNYVARGGILMVHGEYWNSYASSLLNSLFGFALEEWYPDALPKLEAASEDDYSLTRTAETEGTDFAAAPARIRANRYCNYLWSATFPPGARNLYDDYGWSAVTLFEYGQGLILFLGWNWEDARPVGSQDGGWLEVLSRAMTQRAPLTLRPPTVFAQPLPQTAARGDGVTFTAAFFSATPLVYQWQKDGLDLPAATNAALTLTNLSAGQAGLYRVQARNAAGCGISSNALLTLVEAARNLFDDFDPEIDATQWSGFGGEVRATSYGGCVSPTKSLWFGGDAERFALTRSLDTRSGGILQFHLHFGSKNSWPWRRSNSDSYGVSLESSTNGGLAWAELGSFSPFSALDWTHQSLPLPATARSAATLFRWRQREHRGYYANHWALDDVALLRETLAPRLALQPEARDVLVGSSVTFTVEVLGEGALSYQWWKDDGALPAATNASLTFTPAQETDSGAYWVVATNLHGSVASVAVRLRVVPPEAFIAVFADSVYVPVDSGATVGVPSVLASLRYLDFACGTFDDFLAATNSSRRLLVPSLCFRDLALDLTPTTRAALSNFVLTGGQLIVLGSDEYVMQADRFLNAVFGWRCQEQYGWGSHYPRTPLAQGTPFADGPESLPSTSRVLMTGTLPAGARSLYEWDGESAAVLVELGRGAVVYLGWSWYYAVPNGHYDDGWLAVMAAAARMHLPLPEVPPAVLIQPRSRRLAAGMEACLEVRLVGTPPLTLQWFRAGTPIPDATNASLLLRQVQPADTASYWLGASNAWGEAWSDPAQLTVAPVPAAEDFQVTGLWTTNYRWVPCGPLTGGRRGSIALSAQRAFCTGSESTARFALADLSDGVALGQRYEALISDARTGTLYSLGDETGPMAAGGSSASALLAHDPASGALTGQRVALSDPLDLADAVPPLGLFSGYGRVAVHTGTRVYEILLPSGLVSDLGPMPALRNRGACDWAYWGVAEQAAGRLHLVHPWDPWTIVRTAVPTGDTEVVARMAYLGNLASLSVSVPLGRWYFYLPYSSEFGNPSEAVGYAEAAFRIGAAATPLIVQQPTNQSIATGGVAQLAVRALSATPMGYQWLKDGAPLPAATDPLLTLTNAQLSDAGSYLVRVTNQCGPVLSTGATLTVTDQADHFFDDFEPGLDAAQWSAVTGLVLALPEAGAASGLQVLWFGAAGERQAVTRPMRVAKGDCLQFHLCLATGGLAPWEQPDLPAEGIVLEYATDATGEWQPLACYEPPGFFAWTGLQVALPPEAESAATQFRWHQPVHSGEGCDHWALDDVSLSVANRFHPAETLAPGWTLASNEVAAYAAAWRQGQTWSLPPNPIPVDYVTRAGFLWRQGEGYQYAANVPTAPLWWVPSSSDTNVGPVPPAPAGTAASQQPSLFVPGEPLPVAIHVAPATSTLAYAVEDAFPAGWSAAQVSHQGVADPASSRVRWGPFFDATPRRLTYQATPPPAAQGLGTFVGTASFDGTGTPITGSRSVPASARLQVTYGPQPGQMIVRLAGEWTGRYRIETSTDLAAWEPFLSIPASEGHLEIPVTVTHNEPARFFRARRCE